MTQVTWAECLVCQLIWQPSSPKPFHILPQTKKSHKPHQATERISMQIRAGGFKLGCFHKSWSAHFSKPILKFYGNAHTVAPGETMFISSLWTAADWDCRGKWRVKFTFWTKAWCQTLVRGPRLAHSVNTYGPPGNKNQYKNWPCLLILQMSECSVGNCAMSIKTGHSLKNICVCYFIWKCTISSWNRWLLEFKPTICINIFINFDVCSF